jgi:hypothetical protein
MGEFGPMQTPEELHDLATRFLSLLSDRDFDEIDRCYPRINNAPEPWFRRLLNAEASRRRAARLGET